MSKYGVERLGLFVKEGEWFTQDDGATFEFVMEAADGRVETTKFRPIGGGMSTLDGQCGYVVDPSWKVDVIDQQTVNAILEDAPVDASVAFLFGGGE